jgi:DNA-binding NarL/FixJ family response regulator
MVETRADSIFERRQEKKSSTHSLRLIVADQHQLFRECLASALGRNDRFEVMGRVGEAPELLALLEETDTDLVLVGLDGLGGAVLTLLREVGKRFPGLKVVLVGRDETGELILDCLEAGARGYLNRDRSLAELCSSLEAVARGERICTSRVAQSLFQRLGRLGQERRRRQKLEFLTLTPRELQILNLIADGLSNQDIAGRLYLSVHTVKNHVHKVLETLGVNSRAGAVRYAIERGWLPDRRRR